MAETFLKSKNEENATPISLQVPRAAPSESFAFGEASFLWNILSSVFLPRCPLASERSSQAEASQSHIYVPLFPGTISSAQGLHALDGDVPLVQSWGNQAPGRASE